MQTAKIISPVHTAGSRRFLIVSGAKVAMIFVWTPTSPITAMAVM